jgi:RNA polymerase sigma-70 factor (ECF subfamily)
LKVDEWDSNEALCMIDETTGESEDVSLESPAQKRCDTPEELLVERARQGDHEAFASLFEAYNARICNYLARLVGDEELGRDLAQDTLIAAWRSLPQTLDELRFGPWLYRIATNTARSYLRHARLLSWLPFGLEHVHAQRTPATEPEPGARLAEAERIQLALAMLAPQCRICLLIAGGGWLLAARDRIGAGHQREERQRLCQPRTRAVPPGAPRAGRRSEPGL